MFLSKTSRGIYYLFFNDVNGNRCKVSTRSRLKCDATKFLQSFKISEYNRKQRTQNRPLDEFMVEYLAYAKGVFASGTVYLHELALSQLRESAGNLPIREISPQHIDKLKSELIQKVDENLDPVMSPVTVNERLSKLKAAFNTALRWNMITVNPVKGIQPVSVPEKSAIVLQPSRLSETPVRYQRRVVEGIGGFCRSNRDEERRDHKLTLAGSGLEQKASYNSKQPDF